MQAAHNVKFGSTLGDTSRGAGKNFIERKRVGPGRVGRAAESAEFAMRDADVGGIDVAIDVEIADVAVALFADVIGKPADGEEIVRLKEREAVFGREALVREDSLRDGLEARIGYLELGHILQNLQTPA